MPYASALQSNAQKFRQDYVGPLAIDMKIDDTHYLLKDITSHTLKGDFHMNRLKRAGEITQEGVIKSYKQLRQQMGLPVARPAQLALPFSSNEQLSIAA